MCVCILSETTLNGFDVKRMREEEGRNDRKRKHFFRLMGQRNAEKREGEEEKEERNMQVV